MNENKNFIDGVELEETQQEETNFLDTFANDEEEEIVDLTSEKLEELNKKLPSWSIEPPHKFLK